ncbi:MAG: indolepyruvate oxidoreductase subunit beta [Dethiobacter sp.]|jgi:indolepyruvate ferredoxin oxidoreductase beta subunit|nr:indolepyruvate oxidoreductase subunit beta [Dethiobacter sp.]
MKGLKEPLNIILTGVGGQGNIIASGLVGIAATMAGLKVTIGETYGASQRGGTVMSNIRISLREDFGPLIPTGCGDIIVAFEPLEALRIVSEYGNSETKIIVNNEPIYPLAVLMGESDYPAVNDILALLEKIVGDVITFNATALAREAGDPRVLNMVMIKALAVSGYLPFPASYFDEALETFLQGLPSEKREVNRRAMGVKVELF